MRAEARERAVDAPLQAEAWYRRGTLREKKGRYAEAEQDLERTYLLAAEHGHDEMEAAAVARLTLSPATVERIVAALEAGADGAAS